MNKTPSKKLAQAKERYYLIKELRKYLKSKEYIEDLRVKIMQELK